MGLDPAAPIFGERLFSWSAQGPNPVIAITPGRRHLASLSVQVLARRAAIDALGPAA